MALANVDDVPRLDMFLKLAEDRCFIRDYGYAPIPFKSLQALYGNTYFIAIETMTRLGLKVFYFKGSLLAFKKRCEELFAQISKSSEQYLKITSKFPGIRIFSIGYVPALFSVDFSKDEFADAIRKDFLKYGHAAYDTGENLLGKIYNHGYSSINLNEFNRARTLDFDFFTFVLKESENLKK